MEQRCKNYTTAVYEALQWAERDQAIERETLSYAWQVWKLLETILCGKCMGQNINGERMIGYEKQIVIEDYSKDYKVGCGLPKVTCYKL